MRKLRWLVGMGVVLGLAACFAWQQRVNLQAWYLARGLMAAAEENQEAWAERLVRLGEGSVPRLVRCLQDSDSQASQRVGAVLVRLIGLQTDPAARAALAEPLAAAFPRLGEPGQMAVLQTWTECFQPACHESASGLPGLTQRLLRAAVHSSAPEARRRGLEMAASLLMPSGTADQLATAREMVLLGLADAEPDMRRLAISLALRPEISLVEEVTPLLQDADAGVRRMAMAAVSNSADAIGTDELLRWLHDPDGDVRRLCEAALTWRGLSAAHIQRGRWLTDPRPSVRMQVLHGLGRDGDLEPGVWLRHLSHDPEAAVRVAAVRAACEQDQIDLTDRLQQLAADDPSDTVRQLCQFYLSCRKSRR